MLGNKITFGELLQLVKKLPVDEKRTDLPDWLEVVVDRSRLEEMRPLLENYFGPPLKPAGQSPSREARKIVEGLGGIRANQTLYHIEKNGAAYLAMFWPWEDGILTTVKIGQEGKKQSTPRN